MRISIIVPALNEESGIAETLANLRAQHPHEIIVVDGGSTDGTIARAASAGLVLAGPRGRAAQMNCGAAQAKGDVLLFLHADCLLEAGALESIGRALQRPQTIAGCFRMRVRAEGSLYRAIDACATARVRLTGIAYGDQGLFLRREMFLATGGFPRVRLMEDVLLSLRLRKLGRVAVVPRRIFVSPRRWERAGIIRQSVRNWTLTALAAAGVSPDWLARFYPAIR